MRNQYGLLAPAALMLAAAATVHGTEQQREYSTVQAALVASYPGERYWVWTQESGNDLDGDGVPDTALMAVCLEDCSPAKTQLVVLKGTRTGQYLVLAASKRYCSAQRHFNLAAKGRSLYVEAVNKADASAFASDTDQFRFNKKLADFELIGSSNRWESYNTSEAGGSSVNHLTGGQVAYVRTKGRSKVTRSSSPPTVPLTRLHGLNCLE